MQPLRVLKTRPSVAYTRARGFSVPPTVAENRRVETAAQRSARRANADLRSRRAVAVKFVFRAESLAGDQPLRPMEDVPRPKPWTPPPSLIPLETPAFTALPTNPLEIFDEPPRNFWNRLDQAHVTNILCLLLGLGLASNSGRWSLPTDLRRGDTTM